MSIQAEIRGYLTNELDTFLKEEISMDIRMDRAIYLESAPVERTSSVCVGDSFVSPNFTISMLL